MVFQRFAVLLTSALLAMTIGGCAMDPPQPSDAHLKHKAKAADLAAIPQPVQTTPVLPPPAEAPEDEVYTVVVNRVPVAELLFSLARDAEVNVDIYPGIEGEVTLNAIDQTLPQILDRIANQVDIRYQLKGNTLIISPDTPYPYTYKVDYLNMIRDSSGDVSIATQIGTTGVQSSGEEGGQQQTQDSNNSTTTIVNQSRFHFWSTLVRNIVAILGEESEEAQQTQQGAQEALPSTEHVIPHPEAGLLTVVATRRQHRRIRGLLEKIQESVQRQVLIEATVVEVKLSYQYQTGVDWTRLADGNGFNIRQNMLGDKLREAPFFLLNYINDSSAVGNISITIKALEQFGDVKILSSPKAMVLNNQTAVLKVVDNKVYFTMEAESNLNQTIQQTTFTSTLHTVPVGFVMSVTPQISDTDTVIMNVRPTVSRIIGYVNDPNPALAAAEVESKIPEIQVREIESILRVNSGQTAVLGGLMQDSYDQGRNGLPGLSRTGIADLFGTHDDKYGKTELVIFLRPTVIHTASLDEDLKSFSKYLNDANDVTRKIP